MGIALLVLLSILFMFKRWQTFGTVAKIVYIIAFAFIIIGVIAPIILQPFYNCWMKFSIFLGEKIVSKIVLAFIFYCIFTPVAFILKLCGKDYMKKNFDKDAKTYWEKREKKFEKESLLKQY